MVDERRAAWHSAAVETQEAIMTEAQAYKAGWKACMAGCDGRYMPESSGNGPLSADQRYAWIAGFNDAMEAEDDEEPEPAAAGF